MPEGTFKISPSRLSRFFDDTSNWYRECVLDQSPVFKGSTSSVLGTCVHGLAAMYKQQGIFDTNLVEKYLSTINDPEIDLAYIRSQYEIMGRTLVSNLSPNKGESERFMFHEVIPGFVVGGSIDWLEDHEIEDYKTTSQLNPPTTISRAYWFQQMAYVWMARQKGIDIKRFHIKYITNHVTGRISEITGKPMKDYPCTVGRVTHEVTGDDLLLIEGVVRLVAESVKAFKSKPEIRHLLAQDLRLKEEIPNFLFPTK